MDVLLHVENGRPKRPNTDNRDGLLRPSLSGSPWEDFFTSRMGRNSYGHRDIRGIDDGWECATRAMYVTIYIPYIYIESGSRLPS
jgi:hypothetical protein